jgi:hypothetical protein
MNKHERTERRIGEQQATMQLTTLTSLLAGFAFAWFIAQIDKRDSTWLHLIATIETALTIFVLLLTSIMGALLSIASEAGPCAGSLIRAEALWILATKVDVLLFLVAVAMLSFRGSTCTGLISSAMAAVTAVTAIAVWQWIKQSSHEEG